ncbi:pyrroline-5-carboxylate reductase [Metabacillus fastidiosus]|uniref:pyrroline-5-carboxylate reductase n=1 Tax=Metabacillus fastidiosus TaxID=1458 RepID=UPI003D2953DC
MLQKTTIAFLGAGSMAEAMISGIVNEGIVPANQIIVTNRSNEGRLKELKQKYGVRGMKREDLQFEHIDLFILAMKPKDIDDVLLSLKDSLKENHLLLSVLAGITTSYMENLLHEGQQVIRVMPNTSSAIGESATAISKGSSVTGDNVELTKQLLESIGKVYEIEEDKMDIFTGLAGSGPAYFYYLMEHMESVAAEAGLHVETAREMIAQTILGAAKMVQISGKTPAALRRNVTSPNGTTAAGLKALAEHSGGEAISQAARQAARRSKEISSQLIEKVKVTN